MRLEEASTGLGLTGSCLSPAPQLQQHPTSGLLRSSAPVSFVLLSPAPSPQEAGRGRKLWN